MAVTITQAIMNKIKMDPKTTPGHMLIGEERMEQLTKHGFTLDTDREYNQGELIAAMRFCLTLKDEVWPAGFSETIRENIKTKNKIQRLTIAGALIAAEMDRLRSIQPTFRTLSL